MDSYGTYGEGTELGIAFRVGRWPWRASVALESKSRSNIAVWPALLSTFMLFINTAVRQMRETLGTEDGEGYKAVVTSNDLLPISALAQTT